MDKSIHSHLYHQVIGRLRSKREMGGKNTKGKTFDLTIKAISQGAQQELLYKRWVDRNRAIVDSVSKGITSLESLPTAMVRLSLR